MTWTQKDVEIHAKGYVSDAREWDYWAAVLGVPQDSWPNPLPVTHFVGFRDPQRFQNAQRVFGPPSFVHVHWDHRAMADVAPGDTVVFATAKAQQVVPWSYDDSNQKHDPAYWERS